MEAGKERVMNRWELRTGREGKSYGGRKRESDEGWDGYVRKQEKRRGKHKTD